MNRKCIISLFLGILFFSAGDHVYSQLVRPVQWSATCTTLESNTAEIKITAKVAPNWHLYSQYTEGLELPTVFVFSPSKNYKLTGKTIEPKYTESTDEFGTGRYFEQSEVVFRQKIKILTEKDFSISLSVDAQACTGGKCVQVPFEGKVEVKGVPQYEQTQQDSTENASEETDTSVNTQSETETTISENTQNIDTQTDKEKSESLWKFFLLAFLGGLGGLLMPCVFPMIPMTVSYFLKSKRPKFDASIYGISIVIIFLIIGILLSLIFGPGFANILSTHWIPNLLFALIFIIFAISLLGYFEISLPSKWVNKSSDMENKGGIVGIFFMALTLVLVSFSCTLPIAGAVALNSADGSFFKPILGMLGFSLGIAIPFTVFAFFPGLLKSMPKSGGWMNTLKVVLAFVELAFALKFINVPDQTYHWGILDREIYLALWIVIFGMLGFYLIGKIRFPHDAEIPVQKSWIRYFLSIGVFAFVIYLIPGMFGAPLKAISGWLPPVTTQDFDVNKIVREESVAKLPQTVSQQAKYADKLHLPYGIRGYFDYQEAIAVAKELNRPVFIDFTGHGCVNCRNVEAAVWVDAKVRQKFENELVVLCMYVDDKTIVLNEEDQIKDANGNIISMLGKKNMYIQQNIYEQNSQPCYFVIDHDGSVLSGPVFYERNVDNYLQFLDKGIAKFKQKHH
ncbi:MAG: thioredoxin family protein [Bacteroidales bacterium]|nr:thioredoxin family protein [Bacteroidales bacterium]